MTTVNDRCETEDSLSDRDEADEVVDDDNERVDRFVETSENPVVFKSISMNELKPFHNGSVLDVRITELRKSWYYIRHHWDEFYSFLNKLKHLLINEDGLEFKDKIARDHFDILMSSKQDYLTKDQAAVTELGYEAIRLYTSKEGHSRIYRLSNSVFRQECLPSLETIQSLMFLRELISIDLYNYCQKYPEQANFHGVVYRGICLNADDMMAFKTLRTEPVGKRKIAIPGELFSASASESVAKDFIVYQLKKHDKQLHPLVIRIHVIGLKTQYVRQYESRFPSVVLNTNYAVDIHKLSRHRKEKEVLLRGPFMLILDLFEDETITIMDQSCSVLEVVMVNADRDPIATFSLGDRETLARDTFAAMVTVTRSEFAIDYCRRKELVDDEREYVRILDEYQQKLEELINH